MDNELRIVQGNTFATAIEIHAVDATGQPIADWSLQGSTDLRVWYVFAGREQDITTWQISDGKLAILWLANMQRVGTYDIFCAGKYNGADWRNAMQYQFRIVRFNHEANIPANVVILDGVYQLSAELQIITQFAGGGGGTPSETLPLMDGEAAVGEENAYARGDHRHPSDTNKQDVIADLGTIRAGAEAGATAYQKPTGGIPSTDMDAAVQASLARADSALQSYTETDPVFTASAAHGITSSDITAWNAKQAALTFDEYPTESSNNPVKSGGIYTINTTKQDKMLMETVSNGTTLRAGLNYLHKMTSIVNTLNIILPVPSSIIYLNNTKIEFTTGETPNITFTSSATVTTSLTFEPNTHYLIECYYVPSEWIVDSVDAREKMGNKVTSISSSSTDTEYPSAKAVYDELADKADANAVVTSFNGSTGAVTYTAPVTSVNSQTGAVTISVPTATSDLTNDSGFITAATAPVTSVNGQTGAVTVSVPTIDSALSSSSENPVQNKVIYAAIGDIETLLSNI